MSTDRHDYPPEWCVDIANIPPAWRNSPAWRNVGSPFGGCPPSHQWYAHRHILPIGVTQEEAAATKLPTPRQVQSCFERHFGKENADGIVATSEAAADTPCRPPELAWWWFCLEVRRAARDTKSYFSRYRDRVAEAARSAPCPQVCRRDLEFVHKGGLRYEYKALREEPAPAATVAEDMGYMEDAFRTSLAMQEVILHRVAELVTLGLSAKVGGHRGHLKANDPAKTAARLSAYKEELRGFYEANPRAKWQAAVAHVAEIDPDLPKAEAVRKFLARHGVKAADFGA